MRRALHSGLTFDPQSSTVVHTSIPSAKARIIRIGGASKDSRAKEILQAAESGQGTPRAKARVEVRNLVPDRLIGIWFEADGLGPDGVCKGVVNAVRQTPTPRAKLQAKPPPPLRYLI